MVNSVGVDWSAEEGFLLSTSSSDSDSDGVSSCCCSSSCFLLEVLFPKTCGSGFDVLVLLLGAMRELSVSTAVVAGVVSWR